MIENFKKYICSNCKGKCKKRIVIEENQGLTSIKCLDYEKEKNFEGYVKPKERTAKQKKSIMGFTQTY